MCIVVNFGHIVTVKMYLFILINNILRQVSIFIGVLCMYAFLCVALLSWTVQLVVGCVAGCLLRPVHVHRLSAMAPRLLQL